MKYKLYAGSIDGTNLNQESNNKEELIKLFEDYSFKYEVITATLLDEYGNNLCDDLIGHCNKYFKFDWD